MKSEPEQQTDNKRTTNGQQTDTIEEGKEGEEVKKAIIPYGDVVSFLNEKATKSFKPSTEATRKTIRARFNDGFSLEDF